MEADFLRYYHLDLWAELTGPRLPWCRFKALLNALPWDAATVRAITGGDTAAQMDHILLASVLDQLRGQAWANADPQKRGAQPASMVDELLNGSTKRRGYDALRDRLVAQLQADDT